eukprot:GCRY01001205.1.p1 GENE.GCRY01001205.1~~GCRY01001205.1.p1  ORF type:complete len:298 (-),score=52.09 GCRY01001205.1:648-1541(-)
MKKFMNKLPKPEGGDNKKGPWDAIAPLPPLVKDDQGKQKKKLNLFTLQKEDLREWGDFQQGLCGSCCNPFPLYIMNCFFTPCMVMKQRQFILGGNLDNYVCFGGLCFGDRLEPIKKKIGPKPMLCCEACCCQTCAIKANRNYVQKKYHLKNKILEDLCLFCCAGGGSPVDVDDDNNGGGGCCNGLCVIEKATCCLPGFIKENCCGCILEDDDCRDNCQSVQCNLPYDCVGACFVTQMEVEIRARDYPNDSIGAPGKKWSGAESEWFEKKKATKDEEPKLPKKNAVQPLKAPAASKKM